CRPPTRALPDVGHSSPNTRRIVVDFPEPLGPRKPVTRPGGAVKDSASNTLCVPYTLVSSSTSITPSPRGKWWPGPPRAGSSPDNRRRGDGRERTKWSTAATKVVTFARGACDVRDLPNLVLMGNTDEEAVTEHTG